MLIGLGDDLVDVFKTIKHEVRRGALDRKHAFRYVVLSTLGPSVASRYVVLRQVDENFQMIVYTDLRSEKIREIRTNPQVQLLFYHPQKQVQVIISGDATIDSQNEFSKQHWTKVKGNAERSYITSKPPGTPITDPAEGHVWSELMEDQNFATITIAPTQVEVLQLNKSEHLRARFSKKDNWSGSWIVP